MDLRSGAYGEPLTPLRAYAHGVPRYYMQDFGNAVSHPDSRFYCGFRAEHLSHDARTSR